MKPTKPTAIPRRVHCLGICGRLVGGLALALRELGCEISGTDERQFPPTSDLLRMAGIVAPDAWSKDNLPRQVDAVVTGGLLDPANPELLEAQRRGLPIWNATAFLEEYFLRHSRNVVVAGTKGKTTTTAMLAWILHQSGQNANHLIGGQVRAAGWPLVKLSGQATVVLEGDEYPCSGTDLLPKFLRYHATDLVVTNVSHDHPEVYPTPEAYAKVFESACAQLPKHGTLFLNADDPGAMKLGGSTQAAVRTVGFSARATERMTKFRALRSGCHFMLGGVKVRLLLAGKMNALNAALAMSAAAQYDVSLQQSAAALAVFPGVGGRQEILARIGRSVIYADEAYHPVAMRPLLQSLKDRHPGQRIIVLFGPSNTGGRHGICQRDLPGSLQAASLAVLFPAYDAHPPPVPFDNRKLVRDLTRLGVTVRSAASLPEMIKHATGYFSSGDVILICMPPGPPTMRQRIVAAVAAQEKAPVFREIRRRIS
jgi:UDP-N-acetylmuramate: L-alanyl-gamma-D-glutamyl-meso-diaminopimelate ligase